jgi:hypothetical protein
MLRMSLSMLKSKLFVQHSEVCVILISFSLDLLEFMPKISTPQYFVLILDPPYKDKTVKVKAKKKPHQTDEALKNWRLPTLPGFRPSTIGSGGLNFSVRDGKRCDPADITT